MMPILSYIHRYYQRSYRYAAPLFVYLAGIVFVYMVVPNPVMESYSFSSTFLFAIATWLCYGFIDMEDVTQQMITALHGGGLNRLYFAKLLYIWLFIAPFSVFAVLYPAIFHKFDRAATIGEMAMALASHQIVALLGISLAAWFTVKLFATRLMSFLGLVAVVAVTLAGQGIADKLPDPVSFLGWALPPLRLIVRMLTDYDEASAALKIAAIAVPIVYAGIAFGLYLLVMERRKFDPRGK